MPNERDEFHIGVKKRAAERVNYLCSCPSCRCLTISASDEDENKYSSIGEAAHIYAASPGGKRYNPNMTSAERKSINNCIWLCKNHARLIDTDEVKYTAELLKSWKNETEKYVSEVVAMGDKKANNHIYIFEEWYDKFLISKWENISSYFLKPSPAIDLENYCSIKRAIVWLEKNIHLIKEQELSQLLKSFLEIIKVLGETFILHAEMRYIGNANQAIYSLAPYRYDEKIYKNYLEKNKIEELIFELSFELAKSANKINDILREEFNCEFAREKINLYYTEDVTQESKSVIPEYSNGENTRFSYEEFLKDENKRLF